MAQVSRFLRRTLLEVLPSGWQAWVLDRWPNWRKAAPEGLELVFDRYLGSLRVNINTRFKVERIMWSGEFEPELQRLIRKVVSSGAVCLDIGANVGAITLGLAERVGASGRVIAMEPAPPTFQRLRANLDLNPGLRDRVTALNEGAGARSGRLFWSEETANPGNGSLGETGSLEVRVSTVDEIRRRERLTRLDFMKVDVEGMELAVFEGAKDTLATHGPMLYFETLPRFASSGGDNFTRLESFLRNLDYDLYRTGPGGELVKTTAGGFGDYTIAVRE